ncbi:helix-turn-helix transcriptional regulator [Chitinophaga ginsengisegetis]|uniref:winged helix-turn-helix transcriptional regulator n=1 Tax=Chitinophaga ginsengisegetis TaxID=393003 RepID=UPI0034320066
MKEKTFSKYSDCPNKRSKSIIGSRWKPIIIYALRKRKIRFGQLHAIVGDISAKVFAKCLKELEADEIIVRETFTDTPGRVEYSLTPKGVALVPIIVSLLQWEWKHYEMNQPS